MKNIVFYHRNCLDGFTAAWAASKFLPENTEFIAKQPGAKSGLYDDIDNANIYIVDLSFSKEVLLEMEERSNFIILLDHHKTAVERLKDLDFCNFDMDRSGAMMAWDYFSNYKESPLLIKLVQDRDLWTWKIKDSKVAMLAVDSYEKTFENWDYLNSLSMDELIDIGSAIYRVNKIDLRKHVEWAQITDFMGYEVPVSLCTNVRIKSDLGSILAEGNPFAVIWAPLGEGNVAFSLRSTNAGLDVSEIAKKVGGGGHRNAAGFVGSIDLIKDSFYYDYTVGGLTQRGALNPEEEGWQIFDLT
jgi:uncharacterized protein